MWSMVATCDGALARVGGSGGRVARPAVLYRCCFNRCFRAPARQPQVAIEKKESYSARVGNRTRLGAFGSVDRTRSAPAIDASRDPRSLIRTASHRTHNGRSIRPLA